MLTERKKEIYDLLCDKKSLSVSALSKLLYVSEMTIRRDLTELEAQGYIKRYRGGAVIAAEDSILPVDSRMMRDEAEKRQLGQKAAQYLFHNSNIFIDSGSTCQYIIPHIKKFENITVITNSVKTVLSAAALHIPCQLLGGTYYEKDMCFTGSITEKYAESINVDIAFFSALGISNDGIISDSIIEQVTLRQKIMQNAQKTIFLFEKAKFGKKYLYTLCHRDKADNIIFQTDFPTP